VVAAQSTIAYNTIQLGNTMRRGYGREEGGADV